MLVSEYQRQFDDKKEALKIPSDCTEIGDPTFKAPLSHTWLFEWYLVFDDRKYVRLWEHFAKVKGLLMDGRRIQFAFHYGPIVLTDSDGIPEWKADDPVDFRIDTQGGPPNLHYGARKPHYYQGSIDGLDLGTVDMFVFLKNIFKHRKTGKEIKKIFGFRIK